MANAPRPSSTPFESSAFATNEPPVSGPDRSDTCPGCGRALDPLRAGHVAILEGRFRYFCQTSCKQAYLVAEGRPPQEDVETVRPPQVSFGGSFPSAASAAAASIASLDSAVDDAPPVSHARPKLPGAAPAPAHTAAPARTRAGGPTRRRVEALDALGIVLGALVPALGLVGAAADAARIPLAVASWVVLVQRLLFGDRDPADPHPLVVVVPTTGAIVAACWAAATHDPHTVGITVFAALSCAVAIAVEGLVDRARVRVRVARHGIERTLDVRVRAVQGDDRFDRHACEVKPGEQIIVLPGEIVGVDATITAGESRIVPWLGAQVELVRREGDPVPAGARVLSHQLRMTTTWSGGDRAWLRLLSPRATRVDVAAPTTRAVRRTVERGTPLAAAIVGIAAVAANATPAEILAAMCAGSIAFGAKAACSIVALHFARAHLEALASGITYKDARAFERAASANLAVLNARGTVLMGEPEIVAIEPLGAADGERVLSLAAGAETASADPFASAVLRAARMRGVRPDHVRNATAHAGLGLTGVASSGERLVVGGRAIMLEEKIGVAVIDARVSELEAEGRSVLLVALGDRLIGIIALQDGLRPGARAAVQRLLDARIEPVLLGGEARDTCETIGRALDIEHVRPEVLPADRSSQVRALSDGGSVVAVIGHPAGDDGALGAADVSVAMGAAGSTPGEWSVVVASDDVRDAALALAIPHAARDRARIAIALVAIPGTVALLAIGFGVAPLAVAPIAGLLGAAAVAAHARESGRAS